MGMCSYIIDLDRVWPRPCRSTHGEGQGRLTTGPAPGDTVIGILKAAEPGHAYCTNYHVLHHLAKGIRDEPGGWRRGRGVWWLRRQRA